uniref:Cytochrome P450 n=1 Tax=Discosia rubi TaxID=2502037 RepID=A0A6M6ID75_9PEZI|nr:cytochrome P450 [Discosia rubi]
MFSIWQCSFAPIVLGAYWLIKRQLDGQSHDLEKLPFVKFDNNDIPERYVAESEKLLHSGYNKYIKNGVPFRMRNLVDPNHHQLILPFKYLDEVKSSAQNEMSFQLFSRQAFLLDYLNAPEPIDLSTHIVRGDLNKNLAHLMQDIHAQAKLSFAESIPKCEDWTPLQPYLVIAKTIARMTSLVFAGPELCASEEWRDMMVQFTITLMQTSQLIQRKYPHHWRWIVPWVDPNARKILTIRKRCAELLSPSYQTRLAGEEKFVDGIQWLMNGKPGGNIGLLELADQQLFLSIASIHSTSASALSILYDLLERPEYIPDILEELQSVAAINKSPGWTKRSLEQLEKLDSFMKESQRVNPVGLVTVRRSAVRPYTFSDGLRIPANTHCCFPNYELNHDRDVYPDPDKFDGYRFLNLRHKVDVHKYHFAYVSESSINFGAGAHSCPGRHLASNEIKLILSELLLNYDLKWPEGQRRPPTMFHDFSSNPNPMVDILIRRKKA